MDVRYFVDLLTVMYYHCLSLPCRRFLGEISAVDKGERTVDVLFKDGDRDANVPMYQGCQRAHGARLRSWRTVAVKLLRN